MEKKDMLKLFDLAKQLYEEQQNTSGMCSPIPYCWAHKDGTGELLVFSAFGKHSHKLLTKIKEIRGD